MSYDIDLTDAVTGEVLQLDEPHQMKGGTYAVGGSRYVSINITYNYSRHFQDVFGDKGIRFLYGMTGAESIPHLREGMDALGDDFHADYWKPTEGNAKQALAQLLALAQLRPDGVWKGD